MQKFFFEASRTVNDNFILSGPHQRNTCSPHIHRQIELLFVNSGNNVATINGTSVTLGENQMAIADSYDIHQWKHVTGTSIMIQLPYYALKPYVSAKGDNRLSTNFILDQEVCLRFKSLIDLMFIYASDTAVLEGITHSFTSLLLRHVPLVKSSHPKHAHSINDIMLYIDNNFTQNLTLESVASEFGYSKYYFSKLFNSMLNIRFDNYINMVRCQHAIYLVKNKNQSIIDAALNSGFNAINTFYRVFKNQYGCSIKTYLKELADNTPAYFIEKNNRI